MIRIDCEQYSEEWFSARAGIPTSSNFDKIICRDRKGGWVRSKQAQKYMYELVGERFLGYKEESYMSADMERGMTVEDEAVALYEMLKDVTMEKVGFCYPDEHKRFGCSPDRLGLEIKCPKLSTHIGYLIGKELPTEYFQQVHGQMLVTGLPHIDFMSYYPNVQPFIIRVQRDPDFLGVLNLELRKFCDELDRLERILRNDSNGGTEEKKA